MTDPLKPTIGGVAATSPSSPYPPERRVGVFALRVEGDRLNAAGVLDVLVDASAADASTVAVPCARLDPGFFDLRTGAAGEIVQKFATYRMRLAIIGPLPPEARSSNAFVAFAREANRGSQTWFMETTDELEERLAGA